MTVDFTLKLAPLIPASDVATAQEGEAQRSADASRKGALRHG
jgi:hypothetical protein